MRSLWKTLFPLTSPIMVLALLAGANRADDDPSLGRKADQNALKPYAGLVGDWRGVGMPERGRTRGAWKESANWAWKLSNDSAALEVKVADGKFLKSGILRPGKTPSTFVFEATLADGQTKTFEGQSEDPSKPLVLNLKADSKAKPAPSHSGLTRIKLTPLHDTRLLVLLESEAGDSKTFNRLGEVGYTREGVAFAAGDGAPVCIVTEGRGTIKVSHKGKTYYVCCSGCKDLFEEDPEAVLADADERQKAKGTK